MSIRQSNFRYKYTNKKNPDLDWSQIHETILMLELSVAQIAMAMQDSDESVDVLTTSFTSMYSHLKMIEDAATQLPEESPHMLAIKQAISNSSAFVSNKMQEAIIAFQFYDKLTQRLTHVCTSVSGLANIIEDKAKLFNPHEWTELQKLIQSKYTMQEERVMFEALTKGATVVEALDAYSKFKAEQKRLEEEADASFSSDTGSIELF